MTGDNMTKLLPEVTGPVYEGVCVGGPCDHLHLACKDPVYFPNPIEFEGQNVTVDELQSRLQESLSKYPEAAYYHSEIVLLGQPLRLWLFGTQPVVTGLKTVIEYYKEGAIPTERTEFVPVSDEWKDHAKVLRRIEEALKKRPTLYLERHIEMLQELASDFDNEAQAYYEEEEKNAPQPARWKPTE